jgi:DNA-binding transcriptional LysR family regulator
LTLIQKEQYCQILNYDAPIGKSEGWFETTHRNPRVELRQIRYALTVSRERSFTKAAARLNIAQSAVSEQIRTLEDEIGFEIFHRTARGVEITQRGRLFLSESERVISEVRNLSDVSRQLRGLAEPALTMGISSGLGPTLIPRMFPEQHYPLDLNLEIKTAPTRLIFEGLLENTLDFGIAVEVPANFVPPGLVATPLFKVEMALIFPPRHPFAESGGPIGIDMLANEPIVMNEPSLGYGQIVGAMFEAANRQPRMSAIADDIETIKVLVQSGAGVAIVPAGASEPEGKLGLLKRRAITGLNSIMVSAYHVKHALPQRKQEHFNHFVRITTKRDG